MFAGSLPLYSIFCVDVCRKTSSDMLKASVICRATCGADWSLYFFLPIFGSPLSLYVVVYDICKYPNAQFTSMYRKWATHFQYSTAKRATARQDTTTTTMATVDTTTTTTSMATARLATKSANGDDDDDDDGAMGDR